MLQWSEYVKTQFHSDKSFKWWALDRNTFILCFESNSSKIMEATENSGWLYS